LLLVPVDPFAPSLLAQRYVLRERIAVGGMGEVHLATDERLERQVAVKVLAPAYAGSPDFIERFRREALTAAGLVHPNIAQVYDYGVDSRSHFIVMEYVAGKDLARLLRERGRLTPAATVDIVEQVCAALGAAHRAGVVHRDIKPGNVILTPDGRVKVTDFGIARSLGEATLTETGTVMGTAAYIPPEQARGQTTTAASDIYSLGILLYQMLTGEVPFDGESPVAIAMRHLDEPVPPPSAMVAGLPPALDAVVARATAKSPADRYPDVDAMARALRQPAATLDATRALPVGAAATSVLDVPGAHPTATLPVAAAPASPYAVPPREASPPARRTPRRRRSTTLVWLLAGVSAVLLAGIVAFLLSNGDETPTSAGTKPSASSQARTPSESATTATRPDGRTVPSGIVGQQRDPAVQELISLGVNVRWVLVRSAQPEGVVLGSVPAEGEPMTPGQTVALVVSRGKAPADANTSYVVPDGLVGTDAKDATDRLDHVRVTRVTIPSDAPRGQVVATWPSAGQQTADGVVVLVVSGGPAGSGGGSPSGSPSTPAGNGNGNSSD
jgi:serine/threonine-protein kinase